MPLSHAVLGVLSEEALHGYAVRARLTERVGSFWPVNQGQVYATLDRLSGAGLIQASPAPRTRARGGPRRLYAVRDEGRRAFRDWLAHPGRAGPGDHLGFDDWLAHLAIAERRGEPALVQRALEAQRARCATLRDALGGRAPAAAPAAIRAARALLEAELDWLAEAGRELLGLSRRSAGR